MIKKVLIANRGEIAVELFVHVKSSVLKPCCLFGSGSKIRYMFNLLMKHIVSVQLI